MSEKITIATHDELFKEFYIPLSEAAINTATPTLMRCKCIKNWTGKQVTGVARLSVGRGVGNDVIPAGSTPKSEPINYTPQSLWATSVLDWEAVVASGDDKGAFLSVTQDEIEGTMDFFVLNRSRQIYGTSAGVLGTMDGNAPVDNGGGSFSFTVSDATWFRPYWEAGMIINFHTDQTGFVVTGTNFSTKTITVSRLGAGSYDPSALDGTQNLYMQNSKDKELIGLSEIASATSGTLFGVNVGPGWQRQYKDGDNKPLIPDMLVEGIEMYHNETGDDISMLNMNPIQYTQIANLLEGQKEYTQIRSRDERYADIGFKGLLFNHRRGQTLITTDRMCQNNVVYGVYENDWELRQRPQYGWLNSGGPSGGTRYLRDFQEGEKPKFKAHYGGYEQHFHHPAKLFFLNNLEVPDIF
jgi:hypothetical protein